MTYVRKIEDSNVTTIASFAGRGQGIAFDGLRMALYIAVSLGACMAALSMTEFESTMTRITSC